MNKQSAVMTNATAIGWQ